MVKINTNIILDSCTVTIYSTSQTPVRSSSYEIWQAASALLSVCAMRAKGGSVTGIGSLASILETM